MPIELSDTTHAIVNLASGALIAITLMAALATNESSGLNRERPRGSGTFRDRVRASREEGQAVWADAPPPGRLLIVAYVGLLMVFMGTVSFGPIEFQWLSFFGSFGLTGAAIRRLLDRARKQTVKAGRATLLDITPRPADDKTPSE